MENKYLENSAMYVFDRLTDRFPSKFPRLAEPLFLSIIGNRYANNFYRRSYARKLRRVIDAKARAHAGLEKLLVIVDVNLGDAVMMQTAALALKDCFPAAAVDYACNAAGGALVKGMPEFRRVHNIFGQFMVPTPQELETLRGVIRAEKYDAVLNLCPFLKKKDLRAGSPVIQLYIPLAAEVIRGWSARRGKEDVKIHLSYIADAIVRTMAEGAANKNRRGRKTRAADRDVALRRLPQPVHGAKVYLTHEAIVEAQSFLNERGLSEKFIVLLHADTPFRFTQIPVPMQIGVVKRVLLANSASDTAVLLSAGKPEDGFGEKLLAMLPEELRARVVLVPRLSIAGYAALIDASDVFISADTGPLHIAAAWKYPVDARDALRNTTALVPVYGSTSARMSGYDSAQPGFIPGKQNAPAKSFVAPAPCRNITCIDKPAKTCAVARCFDGLQAQEIADYVNSYLSLLREHAALEVEANERRLPRKRA